VLRVLCLDRIRLVVSNVCLFGIDGLVPFKIFGMIRLKLGIVIHGCWYASKVKRRRMEMVQVRKVVNDGR
jgi:hypothetical protein